MCIFDKINHCHCHCHCHFISNRPHTVNQLYLAAIKFGVWAKVDTHFYFLSPVRPHPEDLKWNSLKLDHLRDSRLSCLINAYDTYDINFTEICQLISFIGLSEDYSISPGEDFIWNSPDQVYIKSVKTMK